MSEKQDDQRADEQSNFGQTQKTDRQTDGGSKRANQQQSKVDVCLEQNGRWSGPGSGGIIRDSFRAPQAL